MCIYAYLRGSKLTFKQWNVQDFGLFVTLWDCRSFQDLRDDTDIWPNTAAVCKTEFPSGKIVFETRTAPTGAWTTRVNWGCSIIHAFAHFYNIIIIIISDKMNGWYSGDCMRLNAYSLVWRKKKKERKKTLKRTGRSFQSCITVAKLMNRIICVVLRTAQEYEIQLKPVHFMHLGKWPFFSSRGHQTA